MYLFLYFIILSIIFKTFKESRQDNVVWCCLNSSVTSALCLCPSKTSNTATTTGTRSGTDMPSTWRGQASCRKSPWWGIELLTKPHLNFLSSSFFIVQIQTTERVFWTWAEPLKLKKPWPLQLSVTITTQHNPAIFDLKHLSCLPSLWLRVKHCNLVRPWGWGSSSG